MAWQGATWQTQLSTSRGLRGRCRQQRKQWKRQTWQGMKCIDGSRRGGERLHGTWPALKRAVEHCKGGAICRAFLTDWRLTTPLNKHFFISLLITKALCPMPWKSKQISNSEITYTLHFFYFSLQYLHSCELKKTKGFWMLKPYFPTAGSVGKIHCQCQKTSTLLMCYQCLLCGQGPGQHYNERNI